MDIGRKHRPEWSLPQVQVPTKTRNMPNLWKMPTRKRTSTSSSDPDFAGRRFSEEKKRTNRPVMTLRILQEASLMTAFGEPGCHELATFASQVEMEGAAGDGDFVGDLKDQDISRSSIKKNPHFPHWWVKFLNFWSFKAASIARGKVWAPIVLWMCQQKEGRLPTDSAGFQRSTSHDHPEKTA